MTQIRAQTLIICMIIKEKFEEVASCEDYQYFTKKIISHQKDYHKLDEWKPSIESIADQLTTIAKDCNSIFGFNCSYLN